MWSGPPISVKKLETYLTQISTSSVPLPAKTGGSFGFKSILNRTEDPSVPQPSGIPQCPTLSRGVGTATLPDRLLPSTDPCKLTQSAVRTSCVDDPKATHENLQHCSDPPNIDSLFQMQCPVSQAQ